MGTVTPELIDATESVLDDHGWTGLTAELVAARAGVNRTTLYRRGLTIKDLLAGAALAAAEEFRQSSLGPLTSPGSAADRLRTLLDTLFDLADRHLALLAGLFDGPTAIFHIGGDDSDHDLITRLEYTEPFERILRDGALDGTLTSNDPTTDAELLFNTAGWTYIHLRRSHQWPNDRARPAVTRIATSFVTPHRSPE